VIADSPRHQPGENQADLLSARAVQVIESRLGAWCTVLSAAPNDYSILGHRLFVDGLARLRPGPVMFDDRTLPFDAAAMADAYRFVIGLTTEPPHSASQVVCVHPARAVDVFSQESIAVDEFREIPEEFSAVRGSVTQIFRSGRSTPSWLASYQRGLEQGAARLVKSNRSTTRSTLQAASEEGVSDALKILSNVLNEELESRPQSILEASKVNRQQSIAPEMRVQDPKLGEGAL
jgi:hypothetical protein